VKNNLRPLATSGSSGSAETARVDVCPVSAAIVVSSCEIWFQTRTFFPSRSTASPVGPSPTLMRRTTFIAGSMARASSSTTSRVPCEATKSESPNTAAARACRAGFSKGARVKPISSSATSDAFFRSAVPSLRLAPLGVGGGGGSPSSSPSRVPTTATEAVDVSSSTGTPP
jgi:hypothetical protein